ncbi:uncharacterized protein BJ212DRAFT_1371605 [Suillus subaureus]|uniref:Uncharacterized protein n=1 Tax=Suillus subaureus TaxID=48587 RepID=A0A9P7JAQ8_9AGAM|nr:uncharacterized protein BJ212DRAFT_1371605 [Suillus subaureus]KAG1812134.1 hypothetical protein BJ212DRAFT_1371605 [Suillus subaureus]
MHGMGHGSHWNPPKKEEVLRKVLEYEIILKAEARNEEWNGSELLKMAWADLMISYPADNFVTDVDLECLTTLEARMFEDSEEAGPAGN